ncbi:hypothetical protein [Ornithinimicrobium panacihumi]|uniref:hypothetical protein n=1 Tax=Ornithinimicrobium panacihumi TaxID=2008449 RepID=UPI003F8BB226
MNSKAETDDVPAEAWPARAAFYAPQLRAYASVVEAAAGTQVDTVLAGSTATVTVGTSTSQRSALSRSQ